MVVKLDKVFHKGIMSRRFPIFISIHPFVSKFFHSSKKKKRVLLSLFRREVDIENLKDVLVARCGNNITHLIYADSLILFCKVKGSVMHTLINRTDTFNRCLGKLSINKNRGLFVLGYLESGCILCS